MLAAIASADVEEEEDEKSEADDEYDHHGNPPGMRLPPVEEEC